MSKITLYHGSTEIIKKPEYEKGNKRNDYGQGFYCTEYIELAKEWSCSLNKKGIVNKYELDTTNLKILDLSSENYNILNWLAILLDNRLIEIKTPAQKYGKDLLIKEYLPDYKNYDVIYGYRADDCYFMFARAFLSNQISLKQLSLAMKLGKLGYQYCLKSEKAFNSIRFINQVEVDPEIYFEKKKARDEKAKQDYYKILENIDLNGIYISHMYKKDA